MKSILYFSMVILLFYSCQLDQENNENFNSKPPKINEQKNEIDSIALPIIEQVDSNALLFNIDFNQFISKIDSSYAVPYLLDSNTVERIDDIQNEESNLTANEVKYLSSQLVENKPTSWNSYQITTFLKLDSLKNNGKYENYLDDLDIGMMARSNANLYAKINVSDSLFMVLWYINYSTYEACPFSAGTVIFGTLFNNSKALNTSVLGEVSGGGDAPYWGSTFVTSQIELTQMKILRIDLQGEGDLDENEEEIVTTETEEYQLKITKNGFETVGKQKL